MPSDPRHSRKSGFDEQNGRECLSCKVKINYQGLGHLSNFYRRKVHPHQRRNERVMDVNQRAVTGNPLDE